MTVFVSMVDAVAGAPSYTGRALRSTQSVFLAGATAARPLGARSGVRPGTPTTTVTATSTVWTIGSHGGVLDLETAAEAGPYNYAVNSVGGLPTGTVTAAHATLPRVDIVYMRVDDPVEADGSAVPAVVGSYLAGTAASTPVAPATPARCMVLATLQVPASGGGAPSVTWVAPYAVAAGGVLPVPTYAALPATPYAGQRCIVTADTNTNLNRPYYHDGTRWHAEGATITYTDSGLATSSTIDIVTTPMRTITDPFGVGVPYKCRVTYILGFITGGNCRAVIQRDNATDVRLCMASATSAATLVFTLDMPTGGTVSFKGIIRLPTASVTTYADPGNHVMITEVSPL